jgi:hypothetical protein
MLYVDLAFHEEMLKHVSEHRAREVLKKNIKAIRTMVLCRTNSGEVIVPPPGGFSVENVLRDAPTTLAQVKLAQEVAASAEDLRSRIAGVFSQGTKSLPKFRAYVGVTESLFGDRAS